MNTIRLKRHIISPDSPAKNPPSEEVEVPQPKKPVRAALAPQEPDDDDVSAEDELQRARELLRNARGKPAPAAAPLRKPLRQAVEPDPDDDGPEEEPAPKKAVTKTPDKPAPAPAKAQLAPSKRLAPPKVVDVEDEDDGRQDVVDDEPEEEQVPPKKAAAKAAPKQQDWKEMIDDAKVAEFADQEEKPALNAKPVQPKFGTMESVLHSDLVDIPTEVGSTNLRLRTLNGAYKTFPLLDILEIHEDDLTSDFMDQASLYGYFSVLAASADDAAARAESNKDQEYAQADLDVREDAERNGTKTTETQIKSKVLTDEGYSKMVDIAFVTKYDLKLIKAVVAALEARANMLISLGAMVRHEESMVGLHINENERKLDSALNEVKETIRQRKAK